MEVPRETEALRQHIRDRHEFHGDPESYEGPELRDLVIEHRDDMHDPSRTADHDHDWR